MGLLVSNAIEVTFKRIYVSPLITSFELMEAVLTICSVSLRLIVKGPWKKRACRGPATITRLPSLFINQFFHNIKLLQPYDVCRHQPEPFYGPDCYICEH